MCFFFLNSDSNPPCLSWFCSPQSAAAAPSPVLGNIPPNDGMPGGPIPPGFFQVGCRSSRCSSPHRARVCLRSGCQRCRACGFFFSKGMLGKQHARVADLSRNNLCSAVLPRLLSIFLWP